MIPSQPPPFPATTTLLLLLCACACLWLSGCASNKEAAASKVIVVPSSATSAPPYRGDGSPPPRRYVVRMSDGQRDWEVEFPESATGYQLRIPLGAKEGGVQVEGDALTAADKEMLENLRRKNVAVEREGIYERGKNKADPPGADPEPGSELVDPEQAPGPGGKIDPWAGREDAPAPTRKSYFLGLENVKKLYQAGRYEMAIVVLKDLEQSYPDDTRIMAMMGTLYLKLGQPDLAREYWEGVLEIDPQDRVVLEALKQLGATVPAPTPTPVPPVPLTP